MSNLFPYNYKIGRVADNGLALFPDLETERGLVLVHAWVFMGFINLYVELHKHTCTVYA